MMTVFNSGGAATCGGVDFQQRVAGYFMVCMLFELKSLLSIGLDGEYNVHARLDKRIARAMNREGAFRGAIRNAENIGKSSDDLVARWDVEHPDDLVVD